VTGGHVLAALPGRTFPRNAASRFFDNKRQETFPRERRQEQVPREPRVVIDGNR